MALLQLNNPPWLKGPTVSLPRSKYHFFRTVCHRSLKILALRIWSEVGQTKVIFAFIVKTDVDWGSSDL